MACRCREWRATSLRPVLGDRATDAFEELLLMREQRGGSPAAPDFLGGW